jgi:hypothetical protein
MKLFSRMGIMLLPAWLGQRQFAGTCGHSGSWPDDRIDVAGLLAHMARDPSGFGMAVTLLLGCLSLQVYLVLRFASRGTFWSCAFGGVAAWLLPPILSNVDCGLHAVWLLCGVFAATLAMLWLCALGPRFRSGQVLVEDGKDHLAVQTEYSTCVLPYGLTLFTHASDLASHERLGGGTYTTYQSVPVSTYGSGGTSYGTATVPVTHSAPVFSYTVTRKTGKTDFILSEIGVDHALRQAAKPNGTTLSLPKEPGLAQVQFTLTPWASCRFRIWLWQRRSALFRPSSIASASRKLRAAARRHLRDMRRTFGTFNRHDLLLDRDLALVHFIGIAGNQVFVQRSTPPLHAVIEATVIARHWRNRHLDIEGHTFTLNASVAGQLDRWIRVQSLRSGRRE